MVYSSRFIPDLNTKNRARSDEFFNLNLEIDNRYKNVLYTTLFPDRDHKSNMIPITGIKNHSDSYIEKKWNLPERTEKKLNLPNISNDICGSTFDWSVRNTLAIALDDKHCLYDCSASKLTRKKLFQQTIKSQRFDKNGDKLAIATDKVQVTIFDVQQDKILWPKVIDAETNTTAISWKDSNNFAFSVGNRVCFKDLRSRSGRIENYRRQNHSIHNDIRGLQWSPDGSMLAMSGEDGVVNVWDPRIGKDTITYKDAGVGKAIKWNPVEPRGQLATGGGKDDPYLRIFNTRSNSKEPVFSQNVTSQVSDILWLKDGKRMIASHGYPVGDKSRIKFWDMRKKQYLGSVADSIDSRVLMLASSPDNELFCSASSDEILCFWKTPYFTINGKRVERKKVPQKKSLFDMMTIR